MDTNKSPSAFFTIVQNESFWLDHWLRYYSQHVRPGSLFILDHDTTLNRDSMLDLAEMYHANVVPVHRASSFDHNWLRDTVESFQSFLLQSYRVVGFAEADEFIVADPVAYPGGLKGLLNGLSDGADSRLHVRASGRNVIHFKDEETALHLNQTPVLRQRKWWFQSKLYSKTMITKHAINYGLGFHDVVGGNGPIDPNVYLVHTHRADWNLTKAKHQENAARKWNAFDLQVGAGGQNRIVDDAELAHWFYTDQDNTGRRMEIPQFVRDAI